MQFIHHVDGRCRSYLLLIPLLYSKRYTPTATLCYRYKPECYYSGMLLTGMLFRVTATAGIAIPFFCYFQSLLQERRRMKIIFFEAFGIVVKFAIV